MSFDAIAPHYRWLEYVTSGSLLQRCRTAFLRELADARDILLLGEGRGRFLVELMRLNPHARITCLDASARMLELTRVTLKQQGLSERWVRWIHADVTAVTAGTRLSEQPFDAVASHFFLDCFRPEQLQQTVALVRPRTLPGARWLISDFYVPDHGWQRLRARLILGCLYAFFRIATYLPARRLFPPDLYLEQAGFGLEQRRWFSFGLLHSDVWVKGG
jgi:ubiquinone/menaquinone biosynthesis C-methylase UbiE